MRAIGQAGAAFSTSPAWRAPARLYACCTAAVRPADTRACPPCRPARKLLKKQAGARAPRLARILQKSSPETVDGSLRNSPGVPHLESPGSARDPAPSGPARRQHPGSTPERVAGFAHAERHGRTRHCLDPIRTIRHEGSGDEAVSMAVTGAPGRAGAAARRRHCRYARRHAAGAAGVRGAGAGRGYVRRRRRVRTAALLPGTARNACGFRLERHERAARRIARAGRSRDADPGRRAARAGGDTVAPLRHGADVAPGSALPAPVHDARAAYGTAARGRSLAGACG